MRVNDMKRFFQSKMLIMSFCTVAAGLVSLKAQDATVRVPEADLKKAAVTKVIPEYPPLARQLHLTGKVEVDVYVTPEGTVEKTQPVSGNPVLTGSATTALKKWKFTPFTADGKPTRAVGTVSFDFH